MNERLGVVPVSRHGFEWERGQWLPPLLHAANGLTAETEEMRRAYSTALSSKI